MKNSGEKRERGDGKWDGTLEGCLISRSQNLIKKKTNIKTLCFI
jgi:hypothetical protein